MRLSIFVNLVGRCDGLLAIFTLVALSPSRVDSKGGGGGGALQLLIHVARLFYMAITYPPRCRWGLLAIVYGLLAFVYLLLAIVYRLLASVYRLPLTRLLTISAYPLACYCLPFTRAACR